MTTQKPLAITLFPANAYLRQGLARRFELFDFHELSSAEARSWLEANGASVSAVVTNGKLGCARTLFDGLPNLQIVAIYGVGFDNIDLPAARARGVIVANTPGVLTDDVADLAVGLVICLLRGITNADRFVRDGCWLKDEYPMKTKVTGKRFGIVGLGRIGKAIAERLRIFGEVSYTGTRLKQVPWVFYDNTVSLARSSDVLIVACAANERTRSLIDAEVLSALGDDGYLVNVARASIVDEKALVNALTSGNLAGAALDVFEDEPNVPKELARSQRVLLTPHIGSATTATRKAMADSVLASLDAFFESRPVPYQVV